MVSRSDHKLPWWRVRAVRNINGMKANHSTALTNDPAGGYHPQEVVKGCCLGFAIIIFRQARVRLGCYQPKARRTGPRGSNLRCVKDKSSLTARRSHTKFFGFASAS